MGEVSEASRGRRMTCGDQPLAEKDIVGVAARGLPRASPHDGRAKERLT
jgi:hypothetical protein